MATSASTDPASDVLIVTPSDSVDLALPSRAIRVTGAGNVQMTTAAGNIRVCAFAANESRNIRATRIWSANTTATGIEAYI